MNKKIVGLVIVIIIVVGITSSILLLQWKSGSVGSITQEEETLQITESGLWYGSGFPYCQGAVVIVNDKNVAAIIQKITVRGIESGWNDVYYWEGEIGSVSSLSPTSNNLTETSVEILVDGKERTFQQATGNIVLDGYKAIVLYVRNAGNISYQDIPEEKVTMAVFTERNVYLEEASLDVESWAIGFIQTEQLTITSVNFRSSSSGKEVSISVTNTGTSPVTINEFRINNVEQSYTPQIVEANEHIVITIAHDWVTGDTYQFRFVTSKGTTFTYTAVAA